MELLLNLAWLLLALPAYWLWRASRNAPAQRFTSLQCLLALGCALFILFPVISATDDLCAMRNEIEESPAGKRCSCPAPSDRHACGKSPCQPALASSTLPPELNAVDGQPVPAPQFVLSTAPAMVPGSRAPPVLVFV
jgi:hypothetical protein